MTEENQSTQEQVQELYAFVASEMQSGADKASIAAKLQEDGMDRSRSEELVDGIYREISTVVQQEQFTAGGLVPAIVGGLLAALVGGGIWAAIAVLADYELGIIAWGIGGLCGFAVVMFSRGSKGLPLQITAVASSILGIFVGKYLSYYFILKQVIAEEQGAEAVVGMSPLSLGMIQFFIQELPAMLSPYDLLWVGLAVFTAWSIPRGSGIKLPQGATGPIG